MGQPVIHLSATSVRAADRVSGLSRGADAYLTEPVEPGELVATVDAVLRYYRARATAEELADRLTQLGRIVHDLHAATSFDQLARSLAAGTAALFGSRAMALVPALGGAVRRAVAGRAEPGGGRGPAGDGTGAAGSTAARPLPPPPSWRAGRPCWSAAGPADRRWASRSRRPAVGADDACSPSSARPRRSPPTRCASTPKNTASR